MKRIASLICVAAASAVIWQCNSPVQSPTDSRAKGQTMSVAFAIKTNSDFNGVARSAFVTISAPDMDSISQQMVFSNSSLYASISNIPLGRNRLFTIRAYDSIGNVRYSGSQTVSLDGSPTRVIIVLRKVSGPVEIMGIIEDSSYWYDTTFSDSTWNDTTHYDTTGIDTVIIGGNCSYDSVPGFVVFKRVWPDSSGTIYQAEFDFSSRTEFRSNRFLFISQTAANKIELNRQIPATAEFIVTGTCTPEIYSIEGITETTDTLVPDTSVYIDGGPCVFDTVSGQAVFKSVSAYSGDTVYQATFDFRSQAVSRSNRNLYVSKRTASKIALNIPVPAEGQFIVRGSCAPEFFTVKGIVPVW